MNVLSKVAAVVEWFESIAEAALRPTTIFTILTSSLCTFLVFGRPFTDKSVVSGAAMLASIAALVGAATAVITINKARRWRQRECWYQALAGLSNLWKELGNDAEMSLYLESEGDSPPTNEMEWWMWRYLLVLEEAWLISLAVSKKTAEPWQKYVRYNLEKPVLIRLVGDLNSSAHFHPDFTKVFIEAKSKANKTAK